MFIVSSVLARVCQLAETRPTFTHTSSEYGYFILQPKRSVVKHMPSDNGCYTLRSMRFGGFNTFNRCNIFANNWFADMAQASQQRQAIGDKLADARNAAAKQKQEYEELEIKLAETLEIATEEKQKREKLEIKFADIIETATEEKQKREELEDKLADADETAFQMGQHYEELEFKLVDTLETATEEKQKREALEVELANVRETVGDLKQECDALKKAREDAEFVADISTMRCERLEFELENEHEKVENLTQQLDRLDNVVKRVKSANAELVDNMKSEWIEESRQADQQHQALRDALEKARGEIEYAADLPKLRCERLEFELEDEKEKVENLTQQCNSLEEAIKKERLANAELVDNMKSKFHEELRQADQQRQALRDALEMARETTREENFERKMVAILLADAREAVVKQNQQWENRWEAMQRDHLAEIEHLRLDTQPKSVEIVQLMSPTSTTHEIIGDEFTTEHCSNGATAEPTI